MSPISIPGFRNNEAAKAEAVAAAPMSRLEERREVLREKFAEIQWDLGGAAYEMAARDYFRLDVLASMASRLQVVDAELAEIERMARLEKAGAAGTCSGCGSLFARGAVYCWRCGRNLNETGGTVVGPSAAGQIVIGPAHPEAGTEVQQAPVTPEPAPAPSPPEPPRPIVPEPPEPAPEAVPEMRA